jgi:hypothetical protein
MSLLGDEGLFHGLSGVGFDVMGIHVNRLTGGDVAKGHQALSQRDLEV